VTYTEKQYSGAYQLPPKKSGITPATDRIRSVALEQTRIQSEAKYRPDNISFYQDALVSPKVPEGGIPIIGTYCNMIPVEIILAMGAETARLGCGNPAAVPIGEEMIPGDVCPLVKASVGMNLCADSFVSKCSVFIIPTSCDAKKKLGEILSDFKPVFMLNLPPEQNANLYLKQTAKELERMIAFISKHLKLKFDRKRLRDEIRKSNTRTSLLRRIQELRNSRPDILSVRDLFMIVQSSYFSHGQEWLDQTVDVVKWLERKEFEVPKPKLSRKRLVLTGAPMIFPNFKVLNVIEESGADIVADTLCSGVQGCFDPVVTDEGWTGALLRSLAMKYVFASICPCFISQDSKLNRVLDLAKEFKVDGVINHALRLCQLCDMENYRTHQILRKNQIPILDVRTDYSLEDTEQLRVRIEAFLETL